MGKHVGKEISPEKKIEMLLDRCSLKLPELYQNLIAAYGEEKGGKTYEEFFEENFKRRNQKSPFKNVGEIMMAEIDIFPAFGWEIWVEDKEENGETVWYEHLNKCPYLDATRKHKLPDPCPIVCDMDVKMGEKYKVAKWQRLRHIPSGDSECCFRITKFE